MSSRPIPTQREIILPADSFIVSKTDPRGRITYANRVFMSISGYLEPELLGQPQSIVRHPDMPRGVFKLLWDTIRSGEECFAYIKNQCKSGDYYWVLANVTADRGPNAEITGYYSVRRKPTAGAVQFVSGLYREMCAIEATATANQAPSASLDHLNRIIADRGMTYETFILSL
ncbi:aerotaxis receptor Aer [Acidihalobacter yilgarnensis]|uniref:Aerotaxis receptor Aer n=1 Tax=Acidihalobacter yilgarnensis TaxID=2819280 RepID=A0A1D8IL25_9GAMM|nr:PAS domain-containing protein [Acidihalobacter yilgarnensis]AOU97176.1 aerotaxis receptor Aer [Acidihalobacter yilgarnensis]